MQRLTALAIVARVLIALATRTYFQPDEYFQSLEPAHHLVFGYGHLTWEWTNPTPIRSIIYPALNAPIFYFLEATGLAELSWGPNLLIVGSKILHGLFASLTDVWTAELARFVLGNGYKSTAFLLSLVSFFNALSLSRSLSNSLETSLTAIAFAYYPWDASVNSTPHIMFNLRRLRVAIIFSALACVIRPTNAVIWIFLYGNLFLALRKYRKVQVRFLLELVCAGAAAMTFMILCDSIYYGKFAFTAFNFLKINLSSVSLFYGSNTWHYYLTQGIPILCTTSLPFVVQGLYTTITSSSSRDKAPKTMVATIVWTIAVYSLAGHKEWRFIHPILPLLHVFGAKALVDATFAYPPQPRTSRTSKLPKPAKSPATPSHRGKRRLGKLYMFLELPPLRERHLYLIFASIPVSLYIVLFYCSGPISVTGFLRGIDSKDLGSSTIGILMPCHSTPGHAYLHRKELANGGIWALGCEPPLQNQDLTTYRSQTDVFFASPKDYLLDYFPSYVHPRFPPSPFPASLPGQPSILIAGKYPWKHEWPRYLVMFGHLLSEPGVRGILEARGYKEVWRGGRSWEGDDDKRKGGVKVWKWTR